MFYMRQQRAIEYIAALGLYKYRRKILDIFFAQQVGIIFNIDPHERMLWPTGRQRVEAGLVFGACVAPSRAIARHDQAMGLVQARVQSFQVMMRIKYWHRDKYPVV